MRTKVFVGGVLGLHLAAAGFFLVGGLVAGSSEGVGNRVALRATIDGAHDDAQVARLPLELGATARANVADGTNVTGRQTIERGDGDASSIPELRRVELWARSRASSGEAGLFAMTGSAITFPSGSAAGANLQVVFEEVSWDASLVSDGGEATVELKLMVQTATGSVLAEKPLTEVARTTVGTQAVHGGEAQVTVPVAVYPKSFPTELRATLFARAHASGGSGATAVEHLVAGYRAVAVAVGTAPPTTQPPPPPAGYRGSITAAQLAQHAAESSCWLLIDGRVYDITPYLRRHPGSKQPVLKACGREATTDFLTQGGRGSRHSLKAVELLGRYYVGPYAG